MFPRLFSSLALPPSPQNNVAICSGSLAIFMKDCSLVWINERLLFLFFRRLETASATQKDIVQRAQLQLARFQVTLPPWICVVQTCQLLKIRPMLNNIQTVVLWLVYFTVASWGHPVSARKESWCPYGKPKSSICNERNQKGLYFICKLLKIF